MTDAPHHPQAQRVADAMATHMAESDMLFVDKVLLDMADAAIAEMVKPGGLINVPPEMACSRFGKLFGGCRFEARHDEVPIEACLSG